MTKWYLLLLLFPTLCWGQVQHSVSVYLTTDAEIYHYGPSYQWNTDYRFNDKYAVSSFVNYWGVNMYSRSLYTLTVAVLLERRVGRRKRFYGAVGIAYQSAWGDRAHYERKLILPTSRWGYRIPVKRWAICPELNLVGPLIESDGYEIFTTPGVGLRLMRN